MDYNTVGFLQTELRQDRCQMKGRCNFPCHLFHHQVIHPLDQRPLKAQCQEAWLSEVVYHQWSNQVLLEINDYLYAITTNHSR